MLVECLTDNRHRTAGDVRSVLTKGSGNLGADGSVSWMFKKMGQIWVKPGPSEDEVTEYMRGEAEKDPELKGQLDRLTGSAAARDYFRHRLTRLKVLEALVARLDGSNRETKAE